MIRGIVKYFYPDLTDTEVTKFGLLSLAFFFTIGAYWMLRLLKDTVFFTIAFPAEFGWAANQGSLFQPWAKTGSVIVVVLMVLIYTKLVDWFEKHKLFYIICSFYAVIFSSITVLLLIREMGGNAALGKWSLAALGWVSYFAIESFGSITVALFWSFTSSITATDAAKRGFPFIMAGAQVGSIGGSALNIFAEQLGGIWRLFLLGSIFVVAIMFLIRTFMRVVPEKDRIGDKAAAKTEKKKEGFIEGFVAGLRLLVTRKYLFGILIISTFYETMVAIIDWHMKTQASGMPEYATEIGFSRFMGVFGVATNGLALFMVLLGTSYIMKRYGLTFCLLVFPVCLGGALTALLGFYRYGAPSAAALLWATFGVMMIAKGLSYAVNNPTKEMMYIPTSKDAKFKAKGWVDMFGSRTAKAGGSQVIITLNKWFPGDLGSVLAYSTLFSLGLIGVWIAAALMVGRANAKLIRDGEIVE